jgi:hypothetical protein
MSAYSTRYGKPSQESMVVSTETIGVPQITREEICPYIGTTQSQITEQRNKIMRPIRASRNARTSSFLFGDLTDLEKFCTNKGTTTRVASKAWARTKEYFQTSRLKNEQGKPLSFPAFITPAPTPAQTPAAVPPGFGPGYRNAVKTAQGNAPPARVEVTSPYPKEPIQQAPDLGPLYADSYAKAVRVLDEGALKHPGGTSVLTSDEAARGAAMPNPPTLKPSECPAQTPCAPCPIKGGRRKTRVKRKSYKKRKTLKRRRYRK